jgi:GTP cyclohydrolase III
MDRKTRQAACLVFNHMLDRKRELSTELAKVEAEIAAIERLQRIEDALVKIALGENPDEAIEIARAALGQQTRCQDEKG